MLGRLLRLANRSLKLSELDYRAMQKVRDGLDLETEGETDAWWWLVGEGYVDYQFNIGSWLTDKGKKALEDYEREH